MIIVGHEFVSDLSALVRAGVALPPATYFDTSVASHWLYPDQGDHSLEHLVLRMTSMDQWRRLGKLKKEVFATLSPEELRARCVGDAAGARQLYPPLAQEITTRGLRPLWDLAMSVLPILAEIGGTGMALDPRAVTARSQETARWLQQEKRALEQGLGIENLRSHPQLAARLFGPLGATPLQRTTTGWSTNRVSLLWARHQAQAQKQDELAAWLSRILDYGVREKLQTTYYRKWEKQSRVHSLYSLGRTSTGRIASFDVNLQNVPTPARELIVPSPGFDYILVGDLGQVELRVAAHISGDQVMQRLLREGRDIHALTTARVLRLPEPKTPREVAEFKKRYERQRATGKMANFACLVPETRILKSDLTWVPVGTLKVGDSVVGFNEDLKSYRSRLNQRSLLVRRARVAATSRQQLFTYRIITDRGTVNVSGDHQWVLMPSKKTEKHKRTLSKQWIQTDHLSPGDRVAFWLPPWDFDTSREAGYLAGFFDGEGSLSRRGKTNPFNISVGNNPGAYLNRVVSALRERGYTLAFEKPRGRRKAVRYSIYRQDEILRFLGAIRPTRLLEKVWRTKVWAKYPKTAVVQKVHPLGVRETVGLRTTTGTIIAEGFYTHNTIFAITADSLMWKLFEDTDGEVLVDEAEAQSYIDAFFSVFSGYGAHMRRGWDAVRRGEPVTSLFGFEWELPRNEEGWRRWLNYPVQGSATWLLMLGLRALHRRLRQEQLQSRIIGTVHDNLVLEVPQRELGRATRALQETCEHPDTHEFGFTLSVPLVLDVKVGPNWATLEEVSE